MSCHLFEATQSDFPSNQSHLHSDDAVDEEDECDEDADPRERLEGLDEGPEERADALALRQQLHQPHHAEQPEEVDGDHAVPRLEATKIILCMKSRQGPYNWGLCICLWMLSLTGQCSLHPR